jgi:hypothetical protein
MPQFELEMRETLHSGLVRGRDLEDAVRRALELGPAAPVALGDPDGAAAWREIVIGGAPAGRGRPHQRMRFRRD